MLERGSAQKVTTPDEGVKRMIIVYGATMIMSCTSAFGLPHARRRVLREAVAAARGAPFVDIVFRGGFGCHLRPGASCLRALELHARIPARRLGCASSWTFELRAAP